MLIVSGMLVTLFPASQWVCHEGQYLASPLNSCALGAPILSCVSKGVPGIFMDCHMMVAQPEKVAVQITCSRHGETDFVTKWVNDIADAGGALYCFHMEATSGWFS